MKQRGMELWLGVFVLAGLGIIVTLVLGFGGLLRMSRPLLRMSPPTYEVNVEFERVTGLRAGTPVRMLGIDIGQVKDLRFMKEGRGVALTLEIDGDVDIPSDAPLMVLTEGLLGDNYLEFGGGTGEPLSRKGDALVIGEPFRSPQEYLKEAVNGFKGTAATYEELARNLNKRLSDEEFFGNLKAAAAAVPKTIESFKATADELQKLTQQVSGEASELSAELKKLSESVNAQVEHQGKNLDKITDGLLESTGQLTKTLASLREVTETVRKGEGTVGGLLMRDDVYKEMVATLEKTQKMLDELRETVKFLREHPETVFWGRQ